MLVSVCVCLCMCVLCVCVRCVFVCVPQVGSQLSGTLAGLQAEREVLLRSVRDKDSELASLRQQSQLQQSSLDQWAAWLDNVVSQVLKPHQGSPSLPKAARQFLLKWSFYRYEESSPLAGDLLPHPNPGVRVHPNPGSGLYA